MCLKENQPETVKQRADTIIEHINAFNKHREQPYYLTISVGAYLISNTMEEITLMQDKANTARKNRTDQQDVSTLFHTDHYSKKRNKEKELLNLLHHSLKNHHFELYLQPKVDLNTHKTVGAEALVRWQHPQYGVIYPSEFIPLFENTGDICKIDLYIFEEVCRMLGNWIKEGKKLIQISVNLSRQHFKRPHFLEDYDAIRRKYGIPKGILEMELTESIFFTNQDIRGVKQYIDQMHQMGFLCSLDDFGSGYSSLGLLKDFNVDSIKLDRCFFTDNTQQRAKDVITAIVQLAQKLKICTVAEGIETAQQLSFLQEIHCDWVQGYVFAKPMPVEAFEAWLAEPLTV